MQEIAFTKVRLPYGWLGNMSPYPIEFDGKLWKTTEALFQALRFCDDQIREAIRSESSPMGCKLKAKSIVNELIQSDRLYLRCVEPQSTQDVQNMELCLRLKLAQHPQLITELKSTLDLPIYEDVTSRGDRGSNLFWGAMRNSNGSWTGQNTLGKLWQKLRSELT